MLLIAAIFLSQISVDQLGASPNDWVDDSAAFQAAADIGGEIRLGKCGVDSNGNRVPYLLKKGIKITKSCRWVGQGGKGDLGSTWIVVDCGSEPGFHRGTYARMVKTGQTITDEIVGPLNQGTGLAMQFEHMNIQAVGPTSTAISLYNVSAPQVIRCVTISCEARGIHASQTFNASFSDCAFHGAFNAPNCRDAWAREHFGLCVSGHATVDQCSFQGLGCGLLVAGPQVTVKGSRVEMCHHGIWFTDKNYGLEHYGQGTQAIASIDDVMTESNEVSIRLDGVARVSGHQVTITSNRLDRGRVGLLLGKSSRAKLDGLICSGMYSHAAAKLDGQPLRHFDITVTNSNQSAPAFSRPLGEVVSSSAWSTGHAAFHQVPSIDQATQAAPKKIRYVSTICYEGGETVGASPAAFDIEAPAGSRIKMTFFGLPQSSNLQPVRCRRVYRLSVSSDNPDDVRVDGFWEIPPAQSTFTDDGQSFTGIEYPRS